MHNNSTIMEELTKENLIWIFKAKLLSLKFNNLSPALLKIPSTDFHSLEFRGNPSLFHHDAISAILHLDENANLKHIFMLIFMLRASMNWVSLFLARFVTNKKRQFDFRAKIPESVEFKLFSMSIRFGGKEAMNSLRRSMSARVSSSNFASFIKPYLNQEYLNEYLPPYIKTIDFYFRESLFKYLSFTFFKLHLTMSLVGFALNILRKVAILFRMHRIEKLKKKENIFISKLYLANNSKFLPVTFCLFVRWLYFVGDKFNDAERQTGLVVYHSNAARRRAREGYDEKEKGYKEVRNFAYYYPFTINEVHPEGPNPSNKKFAALRKKRRIFTKFFWSPKKFTKFTFSHKSYFDKGDLFNSFSERKAFFNNDLHKFKTHFYPLLFSDSFKIFDFEAFDLLLHKIRYTQEH